MHENEPLSVNMNSKIFRAVAILNNLHDHETLTIADLCENISIPAPTVYRILRFMINRRVVILEKKKHSANGRHAGIYSIDKNIRSILVVNMEKTILNIAVTDIRGNVIVKSSYPYDSDFTQPEILKLLDDGISQTLRKARAENPAAERIPVIGLSAMAAIDDKTGRIVVFNSMKCLNDFNIVDHMQRAYGKKTVLMKDTGLEVLACQGIMKKRGIGNFIVMHIGVGISVGIVVNGELFTGSFGNAGELMNVHIEKDGEPLSLESLCSTSIIYDRTIEDGIRDPELGGIIEGQLKENPENPDAALMQSIDIALQRGNLNVRDHLDEVLDDWVKLICDSLSYYDPEAAIIGGDISEATPNVFEILRSRLLERNEIKAEILPAPKYRPVEKAIAANVFGHVLDDIIEELYRDGAGGDQ